MRRRATAGLRSATPVAVQERSARAPSWMSSPGDRSPKHCRKAQSQGSTGPPLAAGAAAPSISRSPAARGASLRPLHPACRPPAAPQTRPGPRGPARARRPPGSRGPKPASPSPGRLLLRPCCARAPCRDACASKRSPSAAHHSAHAALAFQLLLFEKQSTEALVTDANLQGCEPMKTAP
jgi:hypothetical protein